MTFKHYYF